MVVSSITTPNFGNSFSERVETGIKRTIADPTDVNNKDAAVGGAVAAGGVGGAAVVASRLKTMKNIAVSGSSLANRTRALNAKNLSLLTEFATNMGKAFKASKLTSWAAKLMENPCVKKFGAGFGGLLALGITGAQLYSAGDMALEAVDTYSKK